MKKLLYILCAAALAAGCSDDDASSYYLDELVIDTANCLAEGSLSLIHISEPTRP